jgi:hypothetical protein
MTAAWKRALTLAEQVTRTKGDRSAAEVVRALSETFHPDLLADGPLHDPNWWQ